MLELEQRALLGDHEAAKRLTEAGVLLGCPFCGSGVNIRRTSSKYRTSPVVIMDEWAIECPNHCFQPKAFDSEILQDETGKVIVKRNGSDEARLAWNTRAPILSVEELQRLEENT